MKGSHTSSIHERAWLSSFPYLCEVIEWPSDEVHGYFDFESYSVEPPPHAPTEMFDILKTAMTEYLLQNSETRDDVKIVGGYRATRLVSCTNGDKVYKLSVRIWVPSHRATVLDWKDAAKQMNDTMMMRLYHSIPECQLYIDKRNPQAASKPADFGFDTSIYHKNRKMGCINKAKETSSSFPILPIDTNVRWTRIVTCLLNLMLD